MQAVSICRTFRPSLLLNLAARSHFSTTAIQQVRFCENSDEAVKDVHDGASILAGGFQTCGVPDSSFRALNRLGVKNLTITSFSAGTLPKAPIGIEYLFNQHQIKRVITTFIGFNPVCASQYLNGEVQVEFCPIGNLVERIRCGGAGIPAFFTPTGYGTLVQTGGLPVKYKSNGEVEIYSKPKETRQINGRNYFVEEALTADFALVKAWKADRKGNVVFRRTSQNVNSDIAKATKCAIVEVEEIVETGELDPDYIHLPFIYVDRIFKSEFLDKRFTAKKLFASKDNQSNKPKSEDDLKRERIARRAVLELKDGMVANLGIGLPSLAANYLKPGSQVTFHAEIGLLGLGPYPKEEELDLDVMNAGAESVTMVKGASVVSVSETFGMIRGGHLDWTFLGGMQVSRYGDLANWIVSPKQIRGMGGAMDLVGASGTKVMVTMLHTEKGTAPKIVEKCTLPLTGKGVVDMLVTELGVFVVDKEKGLTLTEIADGVTLDQVKAATDCDFYVSENLKPMAQAEII